jgi:membrane protease YdiL (CAAX protease family)
MIPLLMAAGLLVEGLAWWVVARRGASVWATMTPVLVGLGIVALLAGEPTLADDPGPAALVGLAAGVVLYVATVAFVTIVARRWTAFRRQSVRIYGRQAPLPLGTALLLSLVLMVPGEELFWRGLFLPELRSALDGSVLGGVLAWVAFVAANVPSLNLAIVAGAAVGGAVWVMLAAWSGGVLAGLLCHACWTGLMLVLPPVRATPEEGTS